MSRGATEHSPSLPGRVQVAHGASQLVAQHTPCKQNPEAQAEPSPQPTTPARALQLSPWQTWSLAQSLSCLQAVPHAAPSQVYGAQLC